MKSILEIQGYSDIGNPDELIELCLSESHKCKSKGDFLGAGEWLASILPYIRDDESEKTFANIVCLWATPLQIKVIASSIRELNEVINEFDPENISNAIVRASARYYAARKTFPPDVNDVSFKLKDQIGEIYGVRDEKPKHLLKAAVAKFDRSFADLLLDVNNFLKSNCFTAKTPAIQVLKSAHTFRGFALAVERPIIGEIDILLGAAFRKFCESCERHEAKDAIRRSHDLTEQTSKFSSMPETAITSPIKFYTSFQLARHILRLLDEGKRRGEEDTVPALKLMNNVFKVDLNAIDREVTITCRLLNAGRGLADNTRFVSRPTTLPIEIELLEPADAFQVAGESEQIVRFTIIIREKIDILTIPFQWECNSLSGKLYSFEDKLTIGQQLLQPDWERVKTITPYSTKPVKRREELFGRDTVLERLLRNAYAGTSTFLWGQKRIGKTSVLQVMKDELSKTDQYICIFLRMGELISQHEGQVAATIADRLCSNLPDLAFSVPNEQDFGASLGRLVPFIDKLTSAYPHNKFVVIIDEFDDMSPAFYMGERGKQFIKALRSLSEIGLTFFFAGSERMATIFEKHKLEINTWVNVSLDRIQSREDCRRLIIDPAKGIIEYHPKCVDSIIDFCGSNPYYMHLLCMELFVKCCSERRTYLSEEDLLGMQDAFVASLGESNFSHFWLDEPEIDEARRAKLQAENCLFLTCLSLLDGLSGNVDHTYEAQDKLGLGINETISPAEIREILNRLVFRDVLEVREPGSRLVAIRLPILSSWLTKNAELRLLPIWKEYLKMKRSPEKIQDVTAPTVLMPLAFPISEEDLLAVSQSLVYCGKQKDAIEIKVWLKQFDDDIRIDLAFLLLKQLSEYGFVNEGTRLQTLSILVEAIHARQTELGDSWKIIRGKKDNLCLSYVDSETKSGAEIVRELQKRLLPGKADAADKTFEWMKSHIKQSPLVVISDDFSGTGDTLLKGIDKFLNDRSNKSLIDSYCAMERILCLLLFAFPEALERLRSAFPKVRFMAARVFDEKVRAFDPNAKIFKDDDEIKFARDVMQQIGRDLTPYKSLGHGDLSALVCFHNTIPNNTLPIFWANGKVAGKQWTPLFPRA